MVVWCTSTTQSRPATPSSGIDCISLWFEAYLSDGSRTSSKLSTPIFIYYSTHSSLLYIIFESDFCKLTHICMCTFARIFWQAFIITPGKGTRRTQISFYTTTTKICNYFLMNSSVFLKSELISRIGSRGSVRWKCFDFSTLETLMNTWGRDIRMF